MLVRAIQAGDTAEGASTSRRRFVNWAGAAAAAAVAFGVDVPGLRLTQAFAAFTPPVDLGSGDVGVLNYAYALEQLEAAFYTQVLSTPYAGMDRLEHSLLSDIRGHEVAHRNFFANALGGSRIPDQKPSGRLQQPQERADNRVEIRGPRRFGV